MSPVHYKQSGVGPRHMAKVLTVDPSTRKIEAMLKDAGLITIAVFDTPSVFVWPQVNEIWIVRRQNNMWMLDRRVDSNEEGQSINDLKAGHARINADTIKTISGNTVIAIDDSNVSSNQVVKYINGKWTVGDPPTGSTIAVGNVSIGTTASVTNTGSSTAAVFDFVIPQGPTGATGPANTLSISGVTTGDPGSDASVSISGTAPSQSLSFTIPTPSKNPSIKSSL